jgi:ferric-dicitrate binding protein FerR (iron transport regulator)
MSDYLFDKQGPPDPEVAELESLLRPLAYQRKALPLPSPSRRRPRTLWLATAALAVSAALVAIFLLRPPPRASWAITGRGRLPVGEWLDTGTERVRLEVATIGTVDLAPQTRARILETGAQHQLQLDHGSLSAVIHAPPRQFSIQTPRALVTDLGCAFTLTVDATGAGSVVVTEGKVALSSGAAEVIVPAGSQCALTAQGPGIPSPSQPAAPPSEKPLNAPPLPTPKKAHKPSKPTKPSPPAHPAATPAQPPKSKPGKNEPPKGPDPGLKLHHDAFRDIDRSVPR